MVWQVYGYMEGQDGFGTSRPKIYGPLPRKRWVPVKGEKRHKVSYKASPAYAGNSKRDDSGHNRQAIEYAEWLARRDGKAIPENAYASVAWTTLPSAYEKTSSGRPVMRKLAMSVTWHTEARDRGGNFSRQGVLTIQIPNWSWEPVPATAETIEPETVDFLLAA